MHPGLLCQRYPCHPSHDCTAPFPEHFPGEFSGSYWQKSPMETVLSTDPRYKHSVPSNVLPTTPWFMSRPLQGCGSNTAGTVTDTVVVGASSIIFLVLAQTGTISQTWFYQRSCLNFIIVIGQEELTSSDLSQKQVWSAHQYLGPGIETRSSKHSTCCSACKARMSFLQYARESLIPHRARGPY